MSFVQMNCKNCGAPLERQGDAYVCGHCGARVINILDADILAEGEVIGAAEFERKLKEQKELLVFEIGDTVRAFDAETEVVNAQLRQAARDLRDGKMYKVDETLRGVSDTVFAAERLRLLADAGARDETELAYWSGDLKKNRHFERVCALGDFEQKRVYERLAEICAENERAGKEIARGAALLNAQAYEDAEKYAAAMCAQYPTDARAWELLIAARCGKEESYDPSHDLKYFFRCPNERVLYGDPLEGETLPRTVSPVIADRLRAVRSKRNARSGLLRKVIGSVAVAVTLGILALVWALIENVFS